MSPGLNLNNYRVGMRLPRAGKYLVWDHEAEAETLHYVVLE